MVIRFFEARPIPPEELAREPMLGELATTLRSVHRAGTIGAKIGIHSGSSAAITRSLGPTASRNPSTTRRRSRCLTCIEAARPFAPRCFCHNDLLNANFLFDERICASSTGSTPAWPIRSSTWPTSRSTTAFAPTPTNALLERLLRRLRRAGHVDLLRAHEDGLGTARVHVGRRPDGRSRHSKWTSPRTRESEANTFRDAGVAELDLEATARAAEGYRRPRSGLLVGRVKERLGSRPGADANDRRRRPRRGRRGSTQLGGHVGVGDRATRRCSRSPRSSPARARDPRHAPARIRARRLADRRARDRRVGASAHRRARARRDPMNSPLSIRTANPSPASNGVSVVVTSLPHTR